MNGQKNTEKNQITNSKEINNEIVIDSNNNSFSIQTDSLEKQFNSFYLLLKEKISQGKYKNVINLINKSFHDYKNIPTSYK